MRVLMSIDRFEGERKDVAVLLESSGRVVNLPRSLLPKDAKAGDVLAFTIERDPAATRQVADQTRRVQDELGRRDTGGDLKL